MINTFEKALACQTRRFNSRKPFMAKAVKTFLKTASLTAVELKQLGKVTLTPPSFRRSIDLFGDSPTQFPERKKNNG